MPRRRPPRGQNPRGGKREGAGRPRGPTALKHLRDLARSRTAEGLLTIATMVNDESSPARLQLAAANAILDLGWGKPRKAEMVEQEDFLTTPDPPDQTLRQAAAAPIAERRPLDHLKAQPNRIGTPKRHRAGSPFTRGTAPGRARPPHQGSFKRGHPKHGGRQEATPNAISARARNAIAAAAKRAPRGTSRNRNHWQWVIEKNPLINEARQRQGQFTLTGAPRVRSRNFNMKVFCRDLSAVAMRAIKTDQFVDRDLVECLELLAVHDPSEFAKFLAIAAPKQSYRAGRPHAEVVEPRAAVNPGEDRGLPTPNAIPPRARKAIAAAAKRAPYGTSRNRNHWQWVIEKNPLINEARQRQGQFTLTGAPRVRSRAFNMKVFCSDLSAVAMLAIKTDQFVDRDLVECLELLAVRDPSEFAKFLAIAAPKQSYLAGRPHAEVIEPLEAINPGAYRVRPIPEWTLGFDPRLNSYTPVPADPALSPQTAYHEVCGAPFNLAPDWDWKFDNEERLYRAIALRPKTPIPEWTFPADAKLGAIPVPVEPRLIPVPVDPKLTPDQAYHPEYGSPLRPAPGWKWQFSPRTQRLLPAISDEPNRFCEPRLYRWHPDHGHYSLVRQEDDWEDYENNLYEYDAERLVFKRVIVVCEYDATKNQFVRVAKSIK